MFNITKEEIQRLISSIDYSEPLTVSATEKDVAEACRTALKFGFRAVVAYPQHIGIIVDELKGSMVKAMIPVGFPCGGNSTLVKCTEAEEGLKRGANDLDMVMNISAFKSRNYNKVIKDIQAVNKLTLEYKVPFKVIIEVGELNDAEIVDACKLIVQNTEANYIKTSTGFGAGRATVHNIMLIKECVGDKVGIKASGYVASIEDGIAFMRAGASIVAIRRHVVEQLKRYGYN